MKVELKPIVFEDADENIADILASSEEIQSTYFPDISCAGVGGAACKEGCLRGCKSSSKDGAVCAESCQPGCKNGCQKGCQTGRK